MKDYEAAHKSIERAGGGDFEGPKAESLVSRAEDKLGIRFPPTYRRFLLELGCGNINGVEVFGLINENFENSTIPNGVWLTLNARNLFDLDHAYLLIGDGGDGSYYALDSRSVDSFGENPVVRLSPDGMQSEKVANDFGAYLLGAVSAVI